MKKAYEELKFEIIEVIEIDVLTASLEGNYDKEGWQ